MQNTKVVPWPWFDIQIRKNQDIEWNIIELPTIFWQIPNLMLNSSLLIVDASTPFTTTPITDMVLSQDRSWLSLYTLQHQHWHDSEPRQQILKILFFNSSHDINQCQSAYTTTPGLPPQCWHDSEPTQQSGYKGESCRNVANLGISRRMWDLCN